MQDTTTYVSTYTKLSGIVAILDSNEEVESKDGENTIHDQQLIFDCISDAILLENEKELHHLIIISSLY